MGKVDANNYLSRYLPDFDTDEKRAHLLQFSKGDLIEMLLISYKNTRLAAKEADLLQGKWTRIEAVLQEPSRLPSTDQPPPNFGE